MLYAVFARVLLDHLLAPVFAVLGTSQVAF